MNKTIVLSSIKVMKVFILASIVVVISAMLFGCSRADHVTSNQKQDSAVAEIGAEIGIAEVLLDSSCEISKDAIDIIIASLPTD